MSEHCVYGGSFNYKKRKGNDKIKPKGNSLSFQRMTECAARRWNSSTALSIFQHLNNLKHPQCIVDVHVVLLIPLQKWLTFPKEGMYRM